MPCLVHDQRYPDNVSNNCDHAVNIFIGGPYCSCAIYLQMHNFRFFFLSASFVLDVYFDYMKKIIGPTLFIQLSIICSIIFFLFFFSSPRNGHRGLQFLSIFGFEIIDRSGQEEKVWVKI